MDYDPSGMLRREINGSTETDYLYDGGDLIAEYVNGTVARRFVDGASGDEPIAWYEGATPSSTTLKYLHADERGSIITTTDASGNATASVKYSSYGESGNLVSPFGYTGQLYLADLQLYYYKARMYSPQAGRFLQPDPAGYGAGMNLYAYAGGDPINMVDPTGMTQVCYEADFPVNFSNGSNQWGVNITAPRSYTQCQDVDDGQYPNVDSGGGSQSAGGGGTAAATNQKPQTQACVPGRSCVAPKPVQQPGPCTDPGSLACYACTNTYLNSTYGTRGGFIASTFNAQQAIPGLSGNSLSSTLGTDLELGALKKGVPFSFRLAGFGIQLTSNGPLSFAIGGAADTFGAFLAEGIVAAGVVTTPFATVATAIARSACGG